MVDGSISHLEKHVIAVKTKRHILHYEELISNFHGDAVVPRMEY